MIFDDVHRMDGPSWEVIMRMQVELRRVAVVLLWRTEFNGQPIILPECAQTVHEKQDLTIDLQI